MGRHYGSYVSYLRVSTTQQGGTGLGVEAQRQAITDWLNGGRWELVAEVVEVESGKRSDRPKLKGAIELCKVHGKLDPRRFYVGRSDPKDQRHLYSAPSRRLHQSSHLGG